MQSHAELNIGLHVEGTENTPEQVTARTQAAINALIIHGHRIDHYLVQNDEPNLVVRVDNPGRFEDFAGTVFELSVRLRQDCIALFLPHRGGYLVGPHADKWGDFNIEFFTRFSAGRKLTEADFGAIRGRLCEEHGATWLHHYGPAVEAEVLRRHHVA